MNSPAWVLAALPARLSARARRRVFLSGIALVLQHEGQLQDHAIADDLALVDHDRLLLHPGAPDLIDGRGRALDADLHGLVEALRGLGADLGDLGYGYGHGGLPGRGVLVAVSWS